MVITRPLQVHPGNLGQLRAWDGDEGQYWASHCDAFERSMARYDSTFFQAAEIRRPSPCSTSAAGAVGRAAGYVDVVVREARAPMWFGADADQAYGFTLGLLGWMLDGLDSAGQDQARRALRATIETHIGADGVTFGSAAWLVTARTGDTSDTPGRDDRG